MLNAEHKLAGCFHQFRTPPDWLNLKGSRTFLFFLLELKEIPIKELIRQSCLFTICLVVASRCPE